MLLIVAGGIWGPRVAFLALIGWGVARRRVRAHRAAHGPARRGGLRRPGTVRVLAPADEGSISLDAAAAPFGVLGALADGARSAGRRPAGDGRPGLCMTGA